MAKLTKSAGHIHPMCCQLAICSLGQKKNIFLEANSKVGYVRESLPVRININPFFFLKKESSEQQQGNGS